MKYSLNDFDYHLPLDLIAQKPANPRDSARLMVLDKKNKDIKHQKFLDLIKLLESGDVLVLNDSKVFPARLFGHKKETGGEVEIFLHKNFDKFTWECLVGGRVKEGLVIELTKNFSATLVKNNNNGTWLVEFNKEGEDFFKNVNRIGHLPLPPYIKREKNQREDKNNYQTVYAADNKIGSVAAPTAGLHFTSRMLKKIKDKGITIEKVTLHVGLGTFAAVKTENILEHKMHSEFAAIDKATSKRLKKAKLAGRRIIAVGTTSCRTLESWGQAKYPDNFSSWTNIFIYPGYHFKTVDALITNFHLPKSTLLMLVSALAGYEFTKKAYLEAVKNKYHFFSYGDAMFIG